MPLMSPADATRCFHTAATPFFRFSPPFLRSPDRQLITFRRHDPPGAARLPCPAERTLRQMPVAAPVSACFSPEFRPFFRFQALFVHHVVIQARENGVRRCSVRTRCAFRHPAVEARSRRAVQRSRQARNALHARRRQAHGKETRDICDGAVYRPGTMSAQQRASMTRCALLSPRSVYSAATLVHLTSRRRSRHARQYAASLPPGAVHGADERLRAADARQQVRAR